MFTFAYAEPLAYISDEGVPVSIGDVIASTFDLRNKLADSLQKTKKDIRVKYDILTEEFLVGIAKHGTKLLHLSSNCILTDYICVEGVNGISNKISLD